ncbi:FmdE family protein [Aminobacterium sp. MB27-C1]|uniref:FmdE family protein n=1 Tax=unclassified Aminobacterium TaxID=2685012 RepID=UPI0027DB94B1|nr:MULTISPECIES: FmdE family protein [unclassified Aminobacterium]MEA4877591.1 FmdE family protein [Aminobacterium sp.]WMI71293.1 FmdE family protein [Aminobacterium sp. MB27-C1]
MTLPTITSENLEQIISFHGHWCPGLAIGIRAAQIALSQIGHSSDEEMVALCETDMCGIDAVQFLTGCTLGKGNLIVRPYGKMAFSFYRRKDGKAIRLVLKKDSGKGTGSSDYRELQKKVNMNTITEEERLHFEELRKERCNAIMTMPIDELFEIKEVREPVPAHAPMTGSLTCALCGESVMETKARFFQGNSYCLPCFEKIVPRP